MPDALEWIRGGEIVCTSGYFISTKSEDETIEWVKGLIERKATALAVKISRFIEKMPQKVITYAKENNLPIINLPSEVVWSNLIEEVINQIDNTKNFYIKKAQKIQDELTQSIINGYDIVKTTQEFANLMENPIIVEDSGFNLISQAGPDINNSANTEEFIAIRLSEKIRSRLKRTVFYKEVLKRQSHEILQLNICSEKRINTVTIPIIARKKLFGFLTLIDVYNKFHTEDFMALENGAKMISLQLMNSSKYYPYTEKEDIVKRALSSPVFYGNEGEEFFFFKKEKFPISLAILSCDVEAFNEKLFLIEHPSIKIKEILKKHLLKNFRDCLIGYEKNQFTTLISLEDEREYDVFLLLKSIFEEVIKEIKSCYEISINVTIGSICHSKNNLKNSLREAEETLKVMKLSNKHNKIINYKFAGISRLLSEIDNYDFLYSYKNEYLSLLINHDEEFNDNLCETLYSYLLNEGNVTASAKALYVHPNTIYYRISKIKEILNYPLEIPEYRNALLLAFEIKNHLENIGYRN